MSKENKLLTAAEVASLLHIKRETVYAYVSRGLLHRHSKEGSRESHFDVNEVERMATQGRRGVAQTSPLVFESALTTVYAGQPYYRGRSVCELAVDQPFEAVAALLWTGATGTPVSFESSPDLVAQVRAVDSALPGGTGTVERLRAMVSVAATGDPLHHDIRPSVVVDMAGILLGSVIGALPALGEAVTARQGDSQIAASLWSRLCPTTPTPAMLAALNAILVVAADHDLASRSTLVARIAASAHADIYSVITAGMHASGGFVQTASALAVESYLGELGERGSVSQALGERLRQGQGTPGFGHPAYPEGDPRAALVLGLLMAAFPRGERRENLRELLDIQQRRGLPEPNIGFAIASLTYLAGMQRGAGDVIFAIARSVGWVAHALEQYGSRDGVGRQQSVYVGPQLDQGEHHEF